MEDYKQKYEQAFEKAKEVYNHKDATDGGKLILESMFPELKEGEDEKIRLDCIKYLDWEYQHCPADVDRKKIEKCVAWLEKQGEQKPTNKIEPKFKVGDMIRCKYDDREFTIKTVDLEGGFYTYTQEGCGNDIDYADDVFELIEQKSAWSEDDEEYCSDVNAAVSDHFDEGYAEELKGWLKSLTERVKGE